jgi:hypothetical protein
VLAFDAPIGVPASLLASVGAASFADWVEQAAPATFEPVASGELWTAETPFVRPAVKGTTWTSAVLAARAAGVELWRRIDVAAGAESMFKLVGPRQVGGAAVALWQELADARRSGTAFAIWPFEPPGDVVVGEIYPAILYERVLGGRPVKSTSAGRAAAVDVVEGRGWVDAADAAWARASDDDLDACLSAVALLIGEWRPPRIVDPVAEAPSWASDLAQ